MLQRDDGVAVYSRTSAFRCHFRTQTPRRDQRRKKGLIIKHATDILNAKCTQDSRLEINGKLEAMQACRLHLLHNIVRYPTRDSLPAWSQRWCFTHWKKLSPHKYVIRFSWLWYQNLPDIIRSPLHDSIWPNTVKQSCCCFTCDETYSMYPIVTTFLGHTIIQMRELYGNSVLNL